MFNKKLKETVYRTGGIVLNHDDRLAKIESILNGTSQIIVINANSMPKKDFKYLIGRITRAMAKEGKTE